MLGPNVPGAPPSRPGGQGGIRPPAPPLCEPAPPRFPLLSIHSSHGAWGWGGRGPPPIAAWWVFVKRKVREGSFPPLWGKRLAQFRGGCPGSPGVRWSLWVPRGRPHCPSPGPRAPASGPGLVIRCLGAAIRSRRGIPRSCEAVPFSVPSLLNPESGLPAGALIFGRGWISKPLTPALAGLCHHSPLGGAQLS